MEVPDGSQRVSEGVVESSIYRGQESRMRRSIDRVYYINPNIFSAKAFYISLGTITEKASYLLLPTIQYLNKYFATDE